MSIQTFHGDNDDLRGLSLHAGDIQHFACVSHLIFTTTLTDSLILPVLHWDSRLSGFVHAHTAGI